MAGEAMLGLCLALLENGGRGDACGVGSLFVRCWRMAGEAMLARLGLWFASCWRMAGEAIWWWRFGGVVRGRCWWWRFGGGVVSGPK